MEILVVDDEANIRELLLRALKGRHVNVTTADNAREGAALMEKRRFDILLTDINMETPTAGVDLARSVRKTYPKTDIIIMTSYSSLDTTINALKIGAYDFIIKPFDLFLVKFAIQRCLERRNLHARIEVCVATASSSVASLQALSVRLAAIGGEEARRCVAVLDQVCRDLESLRALEHPPKLEV